jgi:hypothetical protein
MSDYNLETHEGRLALIRAARESFDPDFLARLGQARRRDPFPVFSIEPGDVPDFPDVHVHVHTRADLLKYLGRRKASPNLWDLLSSDKHPPGTVFYIVFHGEQHSWIRSLLIPKGPQDN